jgi:hypothetical protein
LSAYNLIRVGADGKPIVFEFGFNNRYAKTAKKGNTQYGRLLSIAWYLIQ